MRAGAVIVAAGASTRMAGQDKLFAALDPAGAATVLQQTLRAFAASPHVLAVVVVTNPAKTAQVATVLAAEEMLAGRLHVVAGGARRQDSVAEGLAVLAALPDAARPDWVLIHDGARPFVTPEMIERGLNAAAAAPDGAAIAAVAVKDTIKLLGADGKTIHSTPVRASLAAAQTPQVFRLPDIVLAHAEATQRNLDVTDDASLFEALGKRVEIFAGDYTNIKITTPDDLIVARGLYIAQNRGRETPPTRGDSPQIRIGEGYDAHRLAEGRRLMLGGVDVPHERGLDGHSDADVLLHALINALLGAAGLGDIGRHFPPGDPTIKGIASVDMLAQVYNLIVAAGWRVGNVDATIVAQRPKLAPHIPAMRSVIAACLHIDDERVNVKATTTERMGFAGAEEGIEARAVALLMR